MNGRDVGGDRVFVSVLRILGCHGGTDLGELWAVADATAIGAMLPDEVAGRVRVLGGCDDGSHHAHETGVVPLPRPHDLVHFVAEREKDIDVQGLDLRELVEDPDAVGPELWAVGGVVVAGVAEVAGAAAATEGSAAGAGAVGAGVESSSIVEITLI